MNIYVLNATINGKLMTELLVERLKICGIIGLDINGGNKTSEYYDYTEYCNEVGVPYYQMETYALSNERDKNLLESLDIDLIIVASWQRLVPDWLINHCSIGIIGTHGSHEGIIRGRGRSPQNWALMYGKNKFIFSIFWIEPGIDDGRIIDTEEFDYSEIDTILSSYVKLNILKAELIIKNIENGKIQNRSGDIQNGEALYLPQRTAEDGMIDWNRKCVDIYNMTRALTKPYPGAYTIYDGHRVIVWSAVPINLREDWICSGVANGSVISVLKDGFIVKCADGVLLVDLHEGYNVRKGIVFESANYHEQMLKIVERHKQKYGTPLSDLILKEID